MKKMYLVVLIAIFAFNGILLTYLIKYHASDQANIEALNDEIDNLTSINKEALSKIIRLEDTLNNEGIRIQKIETLLNVEKQEELYAVNADHSYFYETKPLLKAPSIRISLSAGMLPDRFRVYQTVDGKTVNIVYQKDSIIEILKSFSLINKEDREQREILSEKGEYAIVENEKLTLDLVKNEDIEYVQTYSDVLNQVRLDIKFHYEIVMDGDVEDESETPVSVKLADIEQNDLQWWDKYNEVMSFSSQDTVEGSEHVISHTIDYGQVINNDSVTDLKERLGMNKFLKELIKSGWDQELTDQYYKDSDGQFRLYKMYLSKGIAVKSLNGKICNIVYDSGFKDEVLEGIVMDSTKEEIISTLGRPNFSNDQLKIFGYYDDTMYIFFCGDEEINEISIYRNDAGQGYDALMSALDGWSKNRDESLIDRLAKDSEYDFIGGVSAVGLVGYETKGLIIKYDESTHEVRLNVFENADPKLKEALQAKFSEAVILSDHDAIFDLEQYRILINQTIRGEAVTDPALLGMAFASADNFMLSPDKTIGLYYKRASVDDNYACLYITDLVTGRPYDELVVDPNAAKVYWVNKEYIACIGTTVRYMYRLKDKTIIPIPIDMFGANFHIVSVE